MLQSHLFSAGPVIYPLLLCSILTLALVVERLLSLLRYRAQVDKVTLLGFDVGRVDAGARGGLLQGLSLLNQQRQLPKNLRDEVVSVWLSEQRQILLARTRWLMLIGTLAPLMGLLGTVFGIITMFQELAHQTGPVTPAMLASGMWQAMATTAAGLVIAIPALAAAQSFSIWGDFRLDEMAKCLNRCSLNLETAFDAQATQPCALAENDSAQVAA